MNKEDWRTALTEYAEAVERGDIVTPEDYLRRCNRLRKRGLSDRIATDLRASGDARLLRDVEALDSPGIEAINAVRGEWKP